MGKATDIEWAEATWNPWQGCHKVSPACAHCYMFREKARYGQKPDMVVVSKPKTFFAPYSWKDPKLIFTCSWSDFFIEEADAYRDSAWRVISETPHHTYQILTKRPERIAEHLPSEGGPWAWPWLNVWLGVSIENQRFYWRVDILRSIPAALRFLSIEPLLGPMPNLNLEGIGWVIVGGESGPRARPLNIDHVRSIRDQCVAAGVPFFFKQYSDPDLKGKGRALDGREWNEIPGRVYAKA